MSTELKTMIEEMQKGLSDFKALHTRELEEVKASGATSAETKVAVERVSASITDIQAKIQELETVQARGIPIGEATSREERETERAGVRAFLARARGKAVDEVEVTDNDIQAVRAYKGAFLALLRRGGHNGDQLTGEIRATMTVGSDPDGGYLVPPDTSGRIAAFVYESSPIRQIASVQPTKSDRLTGRNDLGEAGGGWVGEQQTRPKTDTPQLGRWEIPVHELYANPDASQKEIDTSIVDIEAWLVEKAGKKLSRLEATGFVSGDGVEKPRGFTTYGAGTPSATTWNVIQRLLTGVNGGFHATLPGDVFFDAIGALKPEYLGNARWVMNRALLTATRKIKDGDGNYLWEKSFQAGTPFMLLGYGITIAEDMPALATDSLSIGFGDFREGYQIVDGPGIRLLRDPYTNKPFVQFYTYRRVGGDVVNFEAIKLIEFSS